MLFGAATGAWHSAAAESYTGRPVAEILDSLRTGEYPFVYSTSLVTDDLVVVTEPTASDPLVIARQILEPHGLTIRTEAGVHLVVRAAGSSSRRDDSESPPQEPAALEIVSVSASRYEISSSSSVTSYTVDRRTIQAMPDIADDPLRLIHRLPGAAASGTSAKTHLRGGEDRELGIMLNGQQLFDPFHIRDYQGLFSTVDSHAIEGIEVYTGGFPVPYGDRLSGLVLMETFEPPADGHTEIGVSVFNTSLLTAGRESNRHWLLSVRRGNLDLVIDPQYGSPSYYDFFAEFALELTPTITLSFNALHADDAVEIVLESDPAELEQVTSSTRNTQFWALLDNRWSERLRSKTVFSVASFDNRRRGTLGDPEKIVGSVDDRRSARLVGVRQDYTFRASRFHSVQWGLEVEYSSGDYDYRHEGRYYGLPAMFPDQPEYSQMQVSASPTGGAYAAWFADQWNIGERTTVEWGFRWDDQTYTNLESDSQLSPRLLFLRSLGETAELRLSWGRYHQSQDIHELQVEDGVSRFWPAQRADHLIVGYGQTLGEHLSLRIEGFQKTIRNVRPRFENLFDPLALIPELEADRVRLSPSGAQAQGLEISLTGTADKFSWWGSIVLSEVYDNIDGREELRSWDQREALQAGLDWRDEKWSLALAVSLHSGWPSTDLSLVSAGLDVDGEEEFVAVPGPRNAERYPAFFSLDARVARTWGLPRGELTAFLEVSNLSNRRNPCCLDWDLEDDAAGNEILERGVDYWMPLIPAVGVLWKF